MLGVACFNYLGLGLFAWFALDKRIEPQNMQSAGARLYGEKAMKRVGHVIRGFLLLAVIAGFPGMILDTTKDIRFLLQNKEPMRVVDKITYTDHLAIALGGIFSQTVVMEKEPEKRWNIQFHFPPLKPDGKMYEFLYIPNTEQILEVREVVK